MCGMPLVRVCHTYARSKRVIFFTIMITELFRNFTVINGARATYQKKGTDKFIMFYTKFLPLFEEKEPSQKDLKRVSKYSLKKIKGKVITREFAALAHRFETEGYDLVGMSVTMDKNCISIEWENGKPSLFYGGDATDYSDLQYQSSQLEYLLCCYTFENNINEIIRTRRLTRD